MRKCQYTKRKSRVIHKHAKGIRNKEQKLRKSVVNSERRKLKSKWKVFAKIRFSKDNKKGGMRIVVGRRKKQPVKEKERWGVRERG